MPPLKDLTNQRFGRLVVIERDYNYIQEHHLKSPGVYWKCKCDCGNTTTVRANSLYGHKVLSCGCLKNENLVGEKFGYLTVIELLPERAKNRHKRYLCQCKCGNQIIVCSTDLKSGNTQSCGCYSLEVKQARAIDLTNQRFGKLTVLSRGETRNGVLYWKCKCDCGSIVEVPSRNLRENRTISCGRVRSRGEEKIANILTSLNIPFEKEKVFPNFHFETGGCPRFDFYLPKQNILIEFNGIQHYEPVGGWNNDDTFEKRVERDNIKRNWVKENKIPLYEISYLEMDEIEKILTKILKNAEEQTE